MASVPRVVTNLTSEDILLVDVIGFSGDPVKLPVGVPVDLMQLAADEDLAKSHHLKNLQADGNISVTTTFEATMDAAPLVRPAGDYAYLELISGDLHTGGLNQKTYALGILTNRPVGSPASGDSNDALVRGSWSNYAPNDTNFIMRGVNMSLANRSGGTIGRMENALGCQGKSGGTSGAIVGLSLTPENYGTVSAEFGGLDINLKNEGAVATLEYGIRVRNLNNSLATKVTSAFLVGNSGANTGFTTGLDMNGALLTNEVVFSNGIKVTVSGDTVVFTNAANTKTATITLA